MARSPALSRGAGPAARWGTPAKVAGIYLVVSVAWILLSDRALEAAGVDPDAAGWIQSVKGCGFVSLTAGLLYWLVRRELRAASEARDRARESDERFRQLADAVADVFWLTDPTVPALLYVSPAYERVFGRPRDEIYARPEAWLDAIHPDDRPAARAAADRFRRGESGEVEYRVVRPDRSVRWVRDAGFPVRDQAGQVVRVAGVAHDFTAHRELEEQYRQAQKMEAVGRLAGGIAHDFNNLLTAILGFSDVALEALPAGSPAGSAVEEVRKASKRAAGLTRQLLAFSRRQVLQPRAVDLNAVVADLGRMLRRVLGPDVELVTDLAPTLHPVLADPGQLEQALTNLVVNARDAMPRGGRVAVRTADVGAGRPGGRPGPYVLLEVTDTGVGMADEVRARIFEPFFTTKPPGHGTGLGLAMVQGFVEQSGGSVEVESAPGRGATFRVYLPRADRPAPAGGSHADIRVAPAGGETVLVVEDEPAVRALTVRVLRGRGYTVLEAGSAAEADRVAVAHPGAIDLLVTDVILPGEGGRPLALRLTAARPGLRVLFMSGYTDDEVVRHGVERDEAHFLQKPFAPAALAAKVREVLDAPAPPPA